MSNEAFEHVPCNLCGADDCTVIYHSKRSESGNADPAVFHSSSDEILLDPLVRCNVCGFQYVTPRVRPEIVLEGYTNVEESVFISQAGARERTFKKGLNVIQSWWKKPPGRMLDIGTGGGSFLKVAKDAGWDAAGCEPNRWLCKWCEENYGIRLVQGTVFDGKFEAESFDVVTLWDVLEHTPDPMSTLREVSRVLKPGGLLVVNVPDIGAWLPRLMGSKWVFLVSVHYFYFTRKTIRMALEKSGFDALTIKPHIQTLELGYIVRRTVPYLGFIGKGMVALTRAIRAEKWQMPYWVGQTLVIARKR